MFSKLNGYRRIYEAIIRPERMIYAPPRLGSSSFLLGNKGFKRKDIRLVNERGLHLEVSIYQPDNLMGSNNACVIYSHGNCGSRLDAIQIAPCLLTRGISVVCFDYSGSGISQGAYVSLGYFEKYDLEIVTEFVNDLGLYSHIGVWGRSMGASTALLYPNSKGYIKALALDSPFISVERICVDYAASQMKIPKGLTRFLMKFVRDSIIEKAEFDIHDVVPLNMVNKHNIPAYFIGADQDYLVATQHIETLHKQYAGSKKITIVEGEHNSQRPEYMIESIANFFAEHLGVIKKNPLAVNRKMQYVQAKNIDQSIDLYEDSTMPEDQTLDVHEGVTFIDPNYMRNMGDEDSVLLTEGAD